ncbi:MAG: hypothetical protein WBE13_11500 [Candidatus Acidiferrum sp.]
MATPYTDQELSDFWYGPGGNAENIEPSAYVLKGTNEIILLTNTSSPSYNAAFDAILGYCYQNRLFGFANYAKPAASNMSYQGRVTGK